MRVQLFVSCLVDLFYPEVGERTVALLPPGQIALLAEEDLVAGVPEALQRVELASGSPPPNIVFAAGPSRTSDIERRSIRGVHAPRELDVVVSPYR